MGQVHDQLCGRLMTDSSYKFEVTIKGLVCSFNMSPRNQTVAVH